MTSISISVSGPAMVAQCNHSATTSAGSVGPNSHRSKVAQTAITAAAARQCKKHCRLNHAEAGSSYKSRLLYGTPCDGKHPAIAFVTSHLRTVYDVPEANSVDAMPLSVLSSRPLPHLCRTHLLLYIQAHNYAHYLKLHVPPQTAPPHCGSFSAAAPNQSI